MILTDQNYYGREAAQKWMSVSQFKAFLKCPSAAYAEITGHFKQPKTIALTIGQYVDSKLESQDAFDAFKKENPQIFKKDGSLKADFVLAETIYQKIVNDKLMRLLLSGRKQVIVTGEIAGVPFRGKLDSLLSAEECETIIKAFPGAQTAIGGPFGSIGAIVDGKVMKDFLPVWSDSEGRRVPFYKAWGYDLQGGVYQSLLGGYKPFVIAAASKESTPDLLALSIPQRELDAALRTVEELAPVFQEIKDGKRDPEKCGRCEWCRSQKVLTEISSCEEIFGLC